MEQNSINVLFNKNKIHICDNCGHILTIVEDTLFSSRRQKVNITPFECKAYYVRMCNGCKDDISKGISQGYTPNYFTVERPKLICQKLQIQPKDIECLEDVSKLTFILPANYMAVSLVTDDNDNIVLAKDIGGFKSFYGE